MGTKALVVFSGGQDSTTCLYWAKKKFDEVHAITFDYGQLHRLEISAAGAIASMAEVTSHEIVEVPNCLISKEMVSPASASNMSAGHRSKAPTTAS